MLLERKEVLVTRLPACLDPGSEGSELTEALGHRGHRAQGGGGCVPVPPWRELGRTHHCGASAPCAFLPVTLAGVEGRAFRRDGSFHRLWNTAGRPPSQPCRAACSLAAVAGSCLSPACLQHGQLASAGGTKPKGGRRVWSGVAVRLAPWRELGNTVPTAARADFADLPLPWCALLCHSGLKL